ncbi:MULTISPECIES: DegV family protein [Brevibacillus]|jgi:DegV family protein with EDD domain|uniref:EDD domain protein, DegV family n=1 Tax=Brevibacillus centrosporus TaxID=54910 RepID=A0A1I3T955_9BACL|nr:MULTISPECIES: DegV family protein [Brevibacillus]MEC2128297.1 DegV family protein [Brevibacillus centrosporus]MED1794253.1 DegV family protein [Brevibacillus nitrificans]MED4909720.1 DegV family protein [Brevibacillus centrosporus]RNB73851.1 DegV family protein [Brevibacillus centrosporus]SFJ67120.1 EDD domain protein, DegV family [Brevibacillus centrosporus]
MPIVILTDSASDIDASVRESLGIVAVPLKVMFGPETYQDGVTISSTAFFEKLSQSSVLPTTSQPSPLEFAEAYKAIYEKYGKDVQIIAIMLSAALSGTYQSAMIAKSMLEESIDITVIDSRKASYVHGMICVDAAKAAQEGKSKQQILDMIDRYLDEVQVYFIVDTLEFLQKGGRIGRAAAVIGSLLNIKPILTLDPVGYVSAFDKVRGTKKALNRVLEALQEYSQGKPVKVAVLHSSVPDQAAEILERIKQEFQVTDSHLEEIGPVIGTHTGPGLLGIVMVKA